MMRGRLRCVLVMLAVGGCGKEGASADADAGPGASADADAGPGASADAGAQAATGRWKGTYKSAEAGITLPKDVKWRVPESTAGVGEGTLALTVDPANGRVEGTLDGVLGPATLDGLAADGKLSAIVVRRDAGDQGFTGTLEGEIDKVSARGTVRLALADTSAVRLATFELSPAPP